MQCGTPEEILSKPSNEYVERFVEHADLSKVLSASFFMQKPLALGFAAQGPHVALYKMDQAGISQMYVVENEKKRVMGYVTIEDVAQAIKQGEKNLLNIMRRDFVAANATTPVPELLEKSLAAPLAVAVLSEKDELQGIITKSHLIAGLGKKEF
jgi:glycine betaine/proline transport system ATP-binding protein